MVWTDELRALWREAAGLRIGAQPLFPTRTGKAYSRDSFQSLWQRWRERVPVADLKWHDIRRKTGSDAGSDDEAAAMLNHASPAVTRKHYRAKPHRVLPIGSNKRQGKE